ncbi:transposase [Nonomuraea antimicrobica]|uniref:transposase n=1 Tax=Nonomuraea antimicrobica TaxID=561173 RepID=UPI0031F14288
MWATSRIRRTISGAPALWGTTRISRLSRRAKHKIRVGVEDTFRQAIVATDLRRARYRGIAKVHLEQVFSAVALNLTRLDAWWNGRSLDRGRTSHLARLELTELALTA